jgi:hypothetical protein
MTRFMDQRPAASGADGRQGAPSKRAPHTRYCAAAVAGAAAGGDSLVLA